MKIELFGSDALDFVEFNVTGNYDMYIRCDTESKYLNTTVFHAFMDCFEKTNKLYDYFVPTKYNARTFVPLLNALKKKRDILQGIASSNDFSDFVSGIFMGERFMLKLKEHDSRCLEQWKKYTDALIKVNNDLIDLVQDCIDEDRVLWVIGY